MGDGGLTFQRVGPVAEWYFSLFTIHFSLNLMQRYEKKYLSEYEKILYDTLILFDTKKYEKMREISDFFCIFVV